MIDDTFVIDAVVHAYNLAPDNQIDKRFGQELSGMLYDGVHTSFQPRGQTQWVMDQERFMQGANVDLLANALFAESQTDACIYHEVPLFGALKDGALHYGSVRNCASVILAVFCFMVLSVPGKRTSSR